MGEDTLVRYKDTKVMSRHRTDAADNRQHGWGREYRTHMWGESNKLIDRYRYPPIPSNARMVRSRESRVSSRVRNGNKEGLHMVSESQVVGSASYLLLSRLLLLLRPRVVLVEGSGGVTLRFLEGGFSDFAAACLVVLVRLVLRDAAGFAGAGFAPSGR
ncbi:hypothetical protein GSI_01029 [Ganoderma sinense ZZ0214-1]|uniref:Uncharacterized protein n=1 Tax=Ganoderma sinense ZZ0214-1 TaxID=1077348 RepID=A0A2G8SU81_9APHY|nr:hypothetical protein GSI_01029 [Ganoderma sinense ZZ0214-1]